MLRGEEAERKEDLNRDPQKSGAGEHAKGAESAKKTLGERKE
jgi:hypothetical protein